MSEQKPFYKKKAIVIPAVLLLSVTLVMAAVLYAQTSVTLNISEALNQTETSVELNGYPGETISYDFSVTNDANVPLNTSLSWTEGDNANGVTYSTDMPKTVTLAPGSNTVSVEFTINPDSTVGSLNGTVVFERTA